MVPEYPGDHWFRMMKKYNYIEPSITWGYDFRRTPPIIKQIKLFPELWEQVIDELPKILRRGKYRKTQVKWLAKKYEVSEKEANHAYVKAMAMHRWQILYEEYQLFPEYFDWLNTPAYKEYKRQCAEELERKWIESNRIIDEQIGAGEEHLIEIGEFDFHELLDRNNDVYENYSGPFSFLAKYMTQHDFETLNNNGLIHIIQGNPETLGRYSLMNHYTEKLNNTIRNYSPLVCGNCGEVLDYNAIGLNKKLGAYEEKDFKCYKHLEMTEKEALDLIEFYKGGGCTLFI